VLSPELLTQGTTSRAAASAQKYRRASGTIAHGGRIHPSRGPDYVGLRVRSLSAVSQPFMGQIPKFVHFGRETAQKRLRNGYRDGQFLAKVTASASSRCVYQSWGVSLPLKLVVVRTTSWREGVLLGRPRVLPDRSVFTPVSTLYLNSNLFINFTCSS
jgi:hypothetical protein